MLLEKFLKWGFLSLLIVWGITYSNQVPEACPIKAIAAGLPVGGKIVDLNNLCTLPVPHCSFSTVSPGGGSGQWSWVYGKTFPHPDGAINEASDVGKDTLGTAKSQFMPCMKETPVGPQNIWHGGMTCNYTGKSLGGSAGAASHGGGCILKGAIIGGAVIGGYYLWKKHKEKKKEEKEG